MRQEQLACSGAGPDSKNQTARPDLGSSTADSGPPLLPDDLMSL